MTNAPAIPSATELSLLKALWKAQPLSARELHEHVHEELAWSFSSTRKTLERMLDKALVAQQRVHGVQVYVSAVDKMATLAAFAQDFSHRVMEMDAPLSAAMFTGSKLVDDAELAQLDALLHAWPQEPTP